MSSLELSLLHSYANHLLLEWTLSFRSQVSFLMSPRLEHLPGPYILLLTGLFFPVSLLGAPEGDFNLLLSGKKKSGLFSLEGSIPTNQAILDCTVCHSILFIPLATGTVFLQGMHLVLVGEGRRKKTLHLGRQNLDQTWGSCLQPDSWKTFSKYDFLKDSDYKNSSPPESSSTNG